MTTPIYTAHLATRDGAREVQILRTLTDGEHLRIETIAVEDSWTQRDIESALRRHHWRVDSSWQDGDDGSRVAVEWTNQSWPVEVIDRDADRELTEACDEADPVWSYHLGEDNGLESYLLYELDRYGWVSYVGSSMTSDHYLHTSKEEAIDTLTQWIGKSLWSRFDPVVIWDDGLGVATGEISGTWYAVRKLSGDLCEWRECDDEETADLLASVWMDELAEQYDRRDPTQRVIAAAYRRAAADRRQRWATQELGDAVRAAFEAGAVGKGSELSVGELAARLRVRREYLYRVRDGKEWNHLEDEW